MHLSGKFASEHELKAKLDFIFSKSKEGKSFHGIWEVAFNEVTIITAVHNIKSNEGSKTPGVDKWDINRVLQMDRNEVIKRIRRKATFYVPKPARRVYIPKSDGRKMRPLGIPTIWDRIIQECLRIVLEPIAEAKFFPHSYGFRPYRVAKHAITFICNTINNRWVVKPAFVIEGDIKGFFDNIHHRTLLNKLWRIGIRDKRVLAIIKQMLKAGYVESELLYATKAGTPQGGIISPLLANIYLNDFDWTVARMYNMPTPISGRQQRKIRESLARKGIEPKFLVRYADDWIVLTTSECEAKRLLWKLKKYFKHKLKLQLSEDKTIITDLTTNPVKFLGFNIQMGYPRIRKKDSKLVKVAKPYPNPQRVTQQIREIAKEIKVLATFKDDKDRAVHIERINSMIVGVSLYWKTCICKATLSKMDWNLYFKARGTFRRIYGNRDFIGHKVELRQLSNRPGRHKDRRSKTFAVNVDGMLVGITYASITHSEWVRYAFDQKETPYTSEGRFLHLKRAPKKDLLDRPPMYDPEDLEHALFRKDKDSKYNFEYYMNREYAYNRDKGKCKVCGAVLSPDNRHCHHIINKLPLDRINKVSNLAWVCIDCHNQIHGKDEPRFTIPRIRLKLMKFRTQLAG